MSKHFEISFNFTTCTKTTSRFTGKSGTIDVEVQDENIAVEELMGDEELKSTILYDLINNHKVKNIIMFDIVGITEKLN